MKNAKTLGIALGVVFVAIVVLQNTQQVPTHILWATIEMPRALLLFTTFALGVGVGVGLAWRKARKQPPA